MTKIKVFTKGDSVIIRNRLYGLTDEEGNKYLNDYLAKKGFKVGYATQSKKYSTRFCDAAEKMTSESTHQIIYQATPLKAEKVECDHQLTVPAGLFKPKEYEEFRAQFTNCPKCGEAL